MVENEVGLSGGGSVVAVGGNSGDARSLERKKERWKRKGVGEI